MGTVSWRKLYCRADKARWKSLRASGGWKESGNGGIKMKVVAGERDSRNEYDCICSVAATGDVTVMNPKVGQQNCSKN